jgi:hypothetical protein
VDQSTDGVVPYRSAHLDGVASNKIASEKVVRSDHGVQKNPEAILETRRILYLHAGRNLTAPGVQEARGPDGSAAVRREPPVSLR